jgi:hypothetical protein
MNTTRGLTCTYKIELGFEKIILSLEIVRSTLKKYHFEIPPFKQSFEWQTLVNKRHLGFIPLQASLHKFE